MPPDPKFPLEIPPFFFFFFGHINPKQSIDDKLIFPFYITAEMRTGGRGWERRTAGAGGERERKDVPGTF